MIPTLSNRVEELYENQNFDAAPLGYADAFDLVDRIRVYLYDAELL